MGSRWDNFLNKLTRKDIAAGGGVDTVFGRIGNVIAVLNDYAAGLINNDSGVAGATVKDALNTLAGLVGITSFYVEVAGSAATASTTDVLLTGMTLTPGAGDYLVLFNSYMSHTSNFDRQTHYTVYVNGVAVVASVRIAGTTNGDIDRPVSLIAKVTGVAGGQAVDIRWRTSNNTATTFERSLTLIKL